MATCRRVELSKEELAVFASELQVFEPEDVKTGLREISRKAREPFETAMPDLGKMLKACRTAADIRIQAIFPPKPVLQEDEPKFRTERCDGPHIDATCRAYLNDEGNAVTFDLSPKRVIGMCHCVRQAQEARAAWRRDIWAPHMLAYHEWESQCDEIRRQHLSLLEVA